MRKLTLLVFAVSSILGRGSSEPFGRQWVLVPRLRNGEIAAVQTFNSKKDCLRAAKKLEPRRAVCVPANPE